MNLREEVESFAGRMEVVLRKHDDERGHEGWKSETIGYLLRRLKEEVIELEKAFDRCDTCAVNAEAVDVGNFAMMISNNAWRICKDNYEWSNKKSKN